MSERIVSSTHIEKTGGISLLAFFEKSLGPERVAFFDPNRDVFVRGADLVLDPTSYWMDKLWVHARSTPMWDHIRKISPYAHRNAQTPNVVPENVVLIHGHYRADQFDDQIDDPLRTVVFREPLDRMRSQYDHWRQVKGRAVWTNNVAYDPKMDFETFAMLEDFRNLQTQALGQKDLSDFAVVGVTANLDGYARDIWSVMREEGIVTGENLHAVQPRNVIPNRYRSSVEGLSQGFKDAFYKFHADDVVLYEAALHRVSAQQAS